MDGGGLNDRRIGCTTVPMPNAFVERCASTTRGTEEMCYRNVRPKTARSSGKWWRHTEGRVTVAANNTLNFSRLITSTEMETYIGASLERADGSTPICYALGVRRTTTACSVSTAISRAASTAIVRISQMIGSASTSARRRMPVGRVQLPETVYFMRKALAGDPRHGSQEEGEK